MGFGNPANRDGHKDSGLSGKITKCTSPEAQQWSGWKTALKPAHEPIVMARKPFKGSCIDNVLTHGTGALNIDATRITTDNEQGRFPSNVLGDIPDYQKYFYCPKVSRAERHCGFEAPPVENLNNPEDMKKHPLWDPSIGTNSHRLMQKIRAHNKGSLDHIATDSDGMLDKGVLYQHTKGGSLDHIITKDATNGGNYMNTTTHPTDPKLQKGSLGDSAPKGKRRCSKDSKERLKQSLAYRKGGKADPLSHIATGNNIGDGVYAPGTPGNKNNAVGKIQTGLTDKNGNVQTFTSDPATHNVGNNHPTVKPVALMRYLIKLVTPKGGKVLDPFTGSGSTGMAAVEASMCFTGCELDPAYVAIANKRIQAWYTRTQPDNNFKELFDASN
jgi:hypothetical protein